MKRRESTRANGLGIKRTMSKSANTNLGLRAWSSTKLALVCVASQWLMSPLVLSAELPQYGHDKHMGVATCANSTCHDVAPNEVEPAADNNVLQNEYQTWLLHDRHAKAYATLRSEESSRIASNLGLKDAVTASVCLDCHADNVPPARQGPEFFMTDGVGCEACHGGSERWLSTHTLKPYDGQRNLNDGMYPTGPIQERTKLCLSCHMGNEQKMVSHDIMGAGHPRLGFELDTFTIRQPEHYAIDADYIARKQNETPLSRLLEGAALQAVAMSENLSGQLLEHPQGYPELVLYDCHSCHHPIDDLNWQSRPSTAGLKPGAIRINDSSFILLAALLAPLDNALHQELSKAIKALHQASTESIPSLRAQAKLIKDIAHRARIALTAKELDANTKQALIRSLMEYGANGEYADYMAAEQAVMGIDVLAYSLPVNPRLSRLVNRAYAHTKDQSAYDQAKFVKDLKAYLEASE